MATRNKMTVDFSGIEIYRKKLNELGGEATERAFESALKASQNIVASNAAAAMMKHNKSGRVAGSIVRDGNVQWTVDVAEIGVGFDIDNGGLPSIFLMYGTKLHGQPHISPDRNLYNAVYGAAVKKQVREIQKQVFEKVIERVMNE